MLAERDTQLVSLRAILTFRVTPVMSDEPQQTQHMAQLMPLPLTVSCSSKIQIGFTFLVPAYPGFLEKRPLNGCCSIMQRLTRHMSVIRTMNCRHTKVQ